MAIHPRAGKPAQAQDLIDTQVLIEQYYQLKPNTNEPSQLVSFGTSGHRGSALKNSFNELHIQAICQAVVEYRQQKGIAGSLFLAKDTHALSEPAFKTALEVLVANNVQVVVQHDLGFTPTPVVSRLIIEHNRNNQAQADGIIITPSHNPPQDGGIKYNPEHGGPAEAQITDQIQQRANQLLANNTAIQRVDYAKAIDSACVTRQDFIRFYTEQLEQVIDMQAIAKAGVKIGVDPLGGSGIDYWPAIAEHYGLNLTVVNNQVDATFGFMCLDKDGQIRMDCSSPYAMASLIELKNDFDIAVGNDADFDRHGIVTPTGGLMNPNHYLAVAIHYLMTHRSWAAQCKVGKTLVSSSLIDRVVNKLGKQLSEVPVGFKWFVDGLFSGEYAFGGEESAGASFLAKDGSCWTTDKDGFILALLAAEIKAVTGKDPYQYYQDLVAELGQPFYGRVEAVANAAQKRVLTELTQADLATNQLAGEEIRAVLNKASGNNAAIGGVKVLTDNGWFAARPSGTEDIYKIYAESFISTKHLQQIIEQAQQLVLAAFAKHGI